MGTALLYLCLDWKGAYGLWPALLFGLSALLGAHTLTAEKRLMRYALAFGLLFSLSVVGGLRLDARASVGGPLDWLLLLLCAGCFAPAVGRFFCWLSDGLERRAQRSPLRNGTVPCPRGYMAVCFAVLAAGWLPAFLAFYPGVFSYDVLAQIQQVESGAYAAANPLMHTLLVGGLYRLGGLLGSCRAGVAAYSLMQLVLIAFSVSYALLTLRREGCPRAACVGILLFMALFPVNAILSVSTTKDPLFGAALVWLCTLLFRGMRERALWQRPGFCALVTLSACLACLMRSNGLPALLIGGALCVVFLRDRSARLRLGGALAAGLVLYAAVTGGLTLMLKPIKAHSREAMSLPIQQMARAFTLHPEQKDDPDVQALFDRTEGYNPAIADTMKSAFRNEEGTSIRQVIALWLRFGRAYPTEYIDAALYVTRGYWDVNDTSHTVIYGTGNGYILTNHADGYGADRRSLWPAMERWYHHMFSENAYQRVPVLSLLCSPALWTWLLLLLLGLSAYARRFDAFAPALLCLGVLLTLLLSACCIIRYAFPLALAGPLLLGMLLAPRAQSRP